MFGLLQVNAKMTSPHATTFEPVPVPVGSAPVPAPRTSSPSINNFLDPLLSLTPEKPRGISKLKDASVQNKVAKDNPKITDQNIKNTGSNVVKSPSNRATNHKRSPDDGSKRVISSNPSVLFDQQRTKSKKGDGKQKAIAVIKHAQLPDPVNQCKSKKDDKLVSSISSAKIDKLTRASSTGQSGNQANAAKKKSALATSSKGRSSSTSKSNRNDDHVKHGKKCVRIVDPTCPLATPELHSTAVLGHQLKQIESQVFDAEEVVLKTLQDSETARTALEERVAEVANVGRNDKKYTGLVSVGVPVDETIQRAVTDRLSRIKTRPMPKKPSKASEVPPPDILEMFSPAMIIEAADMEVTSLPQQSVKPTTTSPDMTFDLYKHMQSWEMGP